MKKNKKRHIRQKFFGQIWWKSKKSFVFAQNTSSSSWFLAVKTMTDKTENTNPNWQVLPPLEPHVDSCYWIEWDAHGNFDLLSCEVKKKIFLLGFRTLKIWAPQFNTVIHDYLMQKVIDGGCLWMFIVWDTELLYHGIQFVAFGHFSWHYWNSKISFWRRIIFSTLLRPQ